MSRNSKAFYKGSGDRRNSRPAGLTGREIGMYYKNLQKRKEQEGTRIYLGPSVSAPSAVLEAVQECLHNFEKQNEQEEERVCTEFEKRFDDLLSVNFKEFIKQSAKQYVQRGVNFEEELSKQYKSQLESKELSADFLRHYTERARLPAMKQHKQILEAILSNQVTLIVGSTGCGKTTQVPQFLIDHYMRNGIGAQCRVVCTQPRRISAISVAQRVATERCEQLGNSVGYQIRLQSVMPRQYGSILYCTTGILLQKMQSDPLMSDLNFIILDEIHERSVETDLLMALLKQLLPYRADLKVILMSATMSENTFREYFDDCCTLRIDGTLFPVEVKYLEDVLQETGYNAVQNNEQKKKPRGQKCRSTAKENFDYQLLIEPYLREIRDRYEPWVLRALKNPETEGCANLQFLEFLIFYICEHKPPGAILVFLPGYSIISKLYAALQSPTLPIGQRHSALLEVYTMHSLIPTDQQQSVFRPASAGKRKVILSTIITETSVTIDDVVYVINTGRTKVTTYDVADNIETLQETWVTKANSLQRKGRAGRVQPGICYNLFTRARERIMDDVPTPDILRSKLESIILNLKLLHISDEQEFLKTLISPPVPAAVQNGINLLKRINALNSRGVLTPLGMHLANLPIDPQMAKMILMSALFRCFDPITSVAASMSFKSPFNVPLGREHMVDRIKQEMAANSKSDHLLINNVILNYRSALSNRREREFCYRKFLNPLTLQQLENMKEQFAGLLQKARFVETNDCSDKDSNVNSKNVPLLRAIIAAGLYPNMAHLRKSRRVRNHVRAIHSMSTPEERRVNFHPSSVNSGVDSFDSNYFVYFQKQKSNAVYLMDATMVFPIALLIFGDNVEIGVTPEHQPFISVAKSFFFKCDRETADVIISLRNRLEWLLQKKALYPSTIKPNSSEQYIISAIQTLLSLDEISEAEDYDISLDDDDDDDDDGDE